MFFTVLSPLDIVGAVFLRSFVQHLHLPASLGSTGITRFLATMEALSPPGYSSSGLLLTMAHTCPVAGRVALAVS